MNATRLLSDRCLSVLDKLTRSAEHELEGLSAELAAHRRDEARLTARGNEIALQARSTLACMDKLQAAAGSIDIAALDRQRAWMQRLAEAECSIAQQLAELVRLIEPLLQRLQALQRRIRVLQRARQRRSDRLVLGIVRRHQREADEQHLLRNLAGAAA